MGAWTSVRDLSYDWQSAMFWFTTAYYFVIVVSIFSGLVYAGDKPTAQDDWEFPLSAATVRAPAGIKTSDPRTTVKWQGEKYDCAEGVHLLTEVIVNHRTKPELRAEALRTLRCVPSSFLHSEQTVQSLVSAYTASLSIQEKRDVIALVHAWSPTCLPLLARVVASEDEAVLRELAAAGLASWNIRRGVKAIARILDECSADASIDRTARNEAGRTFSYLNEIKGWGFPERDVRDQILSKKTLSDEEMSAAFVAEINKWFAENEHRFPDWKPGDPLPKAPAPASNDVNDH